MYLKAICCEGWCPFSCVGCVYVAFPCCLWGLWGKCWWIIPPPPLHFFMFGGALTPVCTYTTLLDQESSVHSGSASWDTRGLFSDKLQVKGSHTMPGQHSHPTLTSLGQVCKCVLTSFGSNVYAWWAATWHLHFWPRMTEIFYVLLW